MARRNRFSWPLAGTLAAAVGVGSVAALVKYNADKRHEAKYGAEEVIKIDVPSDVPVQTTPAFAKPGQLAIATTRPAPINIPTPTVNRPQDSIPAPKPIQQAIAVAKTDDTPRLSPDQAANYQLTNSADLFGQADARIKSDDLLGARKLLVDAINSKKLSPADQDEAFKRLSAINDTVVFSPRVFLDDPSQLQYVVKPGDSMQKIANANGVTWQLLCKINNISDPRRLQAGKKIKVIKGPFHAEVNKTTFILDLYLGQPGQPGSTFVKRYRVGLGENDSTPTGLWAIDTKLEKPKYYNSRNTGPRTVESGDPANPLGTRWLALVGKEGQAVGKESYGIHGTIDPASIGQKKSMGCIRMLNEDVEAVYDILVSGKSTVLVVQ